MITLACPDESLPEWQNLVAALGEHRAFIAFFRNGYDIPDMERALELLGLDKTKWRSVDGKTLDEIKEAQAPDSKLPNEVRAPKNSSISKKLVSDKDSIVIWSRDTTCVNTQAKAK